MPDTSKGFFELCTVDEALERCREAFGGLRTKGERVPASDALGRVLAEEVLSPGPVPHFARSVVDGYAVRAADTTGASAGLPSYLEVVGRVEMGRPPTVGVGPGQAVEIPTGGMLPDGADAAVMVEHTERLGETTIEVGRAVPPLNHVISVGEDVTAGARCLAAGRRVRPGEVALLATLGVTHVVVRRRPVVALLSTGDEVVPPEATPGPAEVRDANSAGLAAMVVEAGGQARFDGIVADAEGDLEEAVARARESADVVIVSGGSSVGERDHAARVLGGQGEPGLLFHGVALKPGKPTIAALAGDTLLFGLPGHPLSAMVSFHRIVAPLLRRLGGEERQWEPRARALLSRKVPSVAGRTELVRVDLVDGGGTLRAEPLFGKSAALSSIIAARGFVEVPLGVEGLDAGAAVDVLLL